MGRGQYARVSPVKDFVAAHLTEPGENPSQRGWQQAEAKRLLAEANEAGVQTTFLGVKTAMRRVLIDKGILVPGRTKRAKRINAVAQKVQRVQPATSLLTSIATQLTMLMREVHRLQAIEQREKKLREAIARVK